MATQRAGMYPIPRSTPRRFRFGSFEADTQTGKLWRNGERVPIQEIPFRFLTALLECPGEVVDREQLRAKVWPRDVNLDFESALDTAARKVRQALGDSAKAPSYIETLPGRGYRFMQEVSDDSSSQPLRGDHTEASPFPDRVVWLRDGAAYSVDRPRRTWPRWRFLVAILVTVLAVGAVAHFLWRPQDQVSKAIPAQRVPSVLALPAKVQGPPESAYLAEAIPATLSTLLASVEGLDVKLPPTALEMERVKNDRGKVVELYGATSLVLTMVTVRKDRLMIDFQLVEASTRKVRWARQVEGSMDDYVGLMRGAATSINEFLRPGMGPLPVALVGNSEVELALAEGHHFGRRYWHLGLEKDFGLALDALRRAEALAPSRPDAPAGMAQLFNDKYWKTRDPSALQAAQACVSRALDRDPRCGQAWMVRSWMETNLAVNAPERAVEYAVKAVCFSPRDPRIHQGLGTVVAGSNGILIAAGRRSMELDPMDVGGYSWVALGLTWNGRASEGLPVIEQALRLEPQHAFNQYLKFLARFRLGQTEEARREWESVRGRDPGFGDVALMLSMVKGDIPGARDLATERLAKWRTAKAGSMDWVNRALFFAPLLLRLGMKDDALWLLRKSVDAQNPPPYDWLLLDADLQGLRGDPRFTYVLSGSRDFARICLRHLDQARVRGELPAYLEPPLEELRHLVDRPLRE